jgi:hypothetical protein
MSNTVFRKKVFKFEPVLKVVDLGKVDVFEGSVRTEGTSIPRTNVIRATYVVPENVTKIAVLVTYFIKIYGGPCGYNISVYITYGDRSVTRSTGWLSSNDGPKYAWGEDWLYNDTYDVTPGQTINFVIDVVASVECPNFEVIIKLYVMTGLILRSTSPVAVATISVPSYKIVNELGDKAKYVVGVRWAIEGYADSSSFVVYSDLRNEARNIRSGIHIIIAYGTGDYSEGFTIYAYLTDPYTFVMMLRIWVSVVLRNLRPSSYVYHIKSSFLTITGVNGFVTFKAIYRTMETVTGLTGYPDCMVWCMPKRFNEKYRAPWDSDDMDIHYGFAFQVLRPTFVIKLREDEELIIGFLNDTDVYQRVPTATSIDLELYEETPLKIDSRLIDELDSILSSIPYVRSGDVIEADHHNLVVYALNKIRDILSQISQGG